MADDKVIELRKQPQSQTPEEAVEWFKGIMEKSEVERVLIIFKEKGVKTGSFACGINSGNYTVADVNFDIDQFKLMFLNGDYEAVD